MDKKLISGVILLPVVLVSAYALSANTLHTTSSSVRPNLSANIQTLTASKNVTQTFLSTVWDTIKATANQILNIIWQAGPMLLNAVKAVWNGISAAGTWVYTSISSLFR